MTSVEHSVSVWKSKMFQAKSAATISEGITISNTSSIIYMLAMYALALIIYVGFKWWRKREGIDINKIYEEIPVE